MDLQQSKIKTAIAACRSSFVYVGIFSFLINLLMLTVPLYMLQIFDRVLASRSYDTLLYLTMIAILAVLVLGLLDMARSKILVRVSTWLDRQLSSTALARGADDVLMGGNYASQSLRDISAIRTFLSGSSVFSLFDFPWTPIYLLVVFLLHPVLGIIATVGAFVLFIFAFLNEFTTRAPLTEANKKHMHNQFHIDRALRNAEAIQAMGMLPAIVRNWFHENETVLKLQALASDRAGMILSLSKFFRMALQLTILGVGAYYVIQEKLTPGAMIAASIITARALAPIEQIIGTWKQAVSTREAYDRLKQFLSRLDLRSHDIELPTPEGRLNVETLTYVPPNTRKPILQGINFQIDPGETLAVIGPSGAGKSTLARIMLGIWMPTNGCVRLDGANVFDWERTRFGEVVGYLPQDVDLFGGTIKENIARMGETDDESVIAAAKMAGAHDLILHLPNGYDTVVGSYNLSGGQRQRIALARALYGSPSFVVLDEPNASLDNDGDVALMSAMQNIKKQKKTAVVISHRPNLVEFADKVLVLNQGRMQLFGERDGVLRKMEEMVQKLQQQENN